MQAKPTKVPLGGSFWLFTAGLVLEISVSAVAARATVLQIIEDQGLSVDLPADRPRARPKPAAVAKGTADEVMDAGIATLRSRCFDQGYAEGLIQAAVWPLVVRVGSDGTVQSVQVDGPGAEMRQCIEREALTWQFAPQSKSQDLFRTVSFASEKP